MWRRLGVEAGERRLFAWAAGTLFLLGWAEVSVQNVSEVLFNKRVDVHLLPIAFLVSSAFLVGTSYTLYRIAARRDRQRLQPVTLLVLGLVLLPLWLLVKSGVSLGPILLGPGLLVVVAKQVPSLGILVMLLALGDLVHSRQAKRLFAPLMAGMTLGTILGSFASDPLGRALGIETLLPLSTGVLLLAALSSLPLGRSVRTRGGMVGALPTASVLAAAPRASTLAELWRGSRLFQLLALTTIVSGILGPMLYFQFQYVTDLATGTQREGEAAMLRIFAQFRGWIGVITLATQIGVASAVFRRVGLPLASAVSPLVYFAGFFGVAVRMSLGAGVGAFAAAKLVDGALFDPAQRVLYNLFRDDVRARATALLEGPLKRGGGALGNVVAQVVIWTGGAGLVAWAGLPLTLGWLVVSLALWRLYPELLLEASTRRRRGLDRLPVAELLDASTQRVLDGYLTSPDPDVCRVAIELCREASPQRAAASLARAARRAPDATRSILVESLDRLLESEVQSLPTHRRAAADLAALLSEPTRLGALERANLVQAYGRLTRDDPRPEDEALLEAARAEPAAAVRLAAAAALAERGDGAGEIDAALAAAAAGADPDARAIAREELRALLLLGDPQAPGSRWDARFALLVGLLERPEERAAAADAIAEVAARHPGRTEPARDAMLACWDDPNPSLRASVSLFVGRTGLSGAARRLVEQVDASDERVAEAAFEGLRALGVAAADALLVELSFGRRSRRELLLRLVTNIEVEEETLRKLLARELEVARRALLQRAVLDGRASPIMLRRLDEKVAEGVHTALLYLAALRSDGQLGRLGEQWRRARDARRRAVLLEALESMLEPAERAALLPLLDEQPLAVRARTAAEQMGVRLPTPAQAARELAADADDLTRALLEHAPPAGGAALAGAPPARDHGGALKPVEIALHLSRAPLFEGLATRHLLDIAGTAREERHAEGALLFREGDFGTSMFFVVDGRVRISHGEMESVELGPGEFFGEVGLLEGAERTAAAQAIEPVRLLRLEREDLLALMEEIPAIAIGVAQILSRRFRAVMEQIGPRQDQAAGSARTRTR